MTQYCPNCNHEFAPEDQRCANCGQPRRPVIQKKFTQILNQNVPSNENEGEVTLPFNVITPATATESPPIPVASVASPASSSNKPEAASFSWSLPSEKELAALAKSGQGDDDEDKTESSLPSFWNCKQCVSLNPAMTDYCETCGALRPSAEPEKRMAATSDGSANPLPLPSAVAENAQVTNPVQQSAASLDPIKTRLPSDVIAALTSEQPVPAKPGFQLISSSLTDVGISRKGGTNEDSFFHVELQRCFESKLETFGFYLVADGMGGQAAGEVASRTAIQTVGPRVLAELAGPWLSGQTLDTGKIDRTLQEVIGAAHTRLYEMNHEEQIDSGTTITACCVVGRSAVFANVGDSRTYLFRPAKPQDDTTDPVLPVLSKEIAPGDRATRKLDAQTDKLDPVALKQPKQPKLSIERVTKDQSLVQHLVDEGELTIDEVYNDPRRNVILFALGAPDETIPVDTYHRELETGDTILLCSDGLWEMVRDPAIAELLLAGPDLPQTAQSLIKLANENGGADNITVILVRVL